VYGVRPEHLRLGEAGTLPGLLTLLEPTGPDTYARMETARGRWTARLQGHCPWAVGTSLALSWDEAAVHLFDVASGQRLG
jgi:multiple sugar transport system ATP-binding protein